VAIPAPEDGCAHRALWSENMRTSPSLDLQSSALDVEDPLAEVQSRRLVFVDVVRAQVMERSLG
jgi:hypothetical protein